MTTADVGQQVLTLVQAPEGNALIDLAVEGTVRVGIHPIQGKFGGIAAVEIAGGVEAWLKGAGGNIPNARHYGMLVIGPDEDRCIPPLPIPPRVISKYPGLFSALLLLRIEAGSRKAWAARASQFVQDTDIAFVAAAHLFGDGDYHGVAEVVADDMDTFHTLLLALSDVAGVAEADLHLIAADRQHGMGTPQR